MKVHIDGLDQFCRDYAGAINNLNRWRNLYDQLGIAAGDSQVPDEEKGALVASIEVVRKQLNDQYQSIGRLLMAKINSMAENQPEEGPR